jgi:hypothetical protein
MASRCNQDDACAFKSCNPSSTALSCCSHAAPCRYYPDIIAEPNNLRGNERCAGANATQPSKTGALVWSDETCTTQAPFMCRVQGEAPGGTSSEPSHVRSAASTAHVCIRQSLSSVPQVHKLF